ncbi:MAG: protein kinase [Ignavibacteriae bacterium]|nr:protein kinase [Ignavibacteriota bacterium]
MIIPGQIISSYNVVAPIGEGGMGKVFLAEHISLKRKAAIKILNPEISGISGIRNRFINEARILANLNHPNIVSIYDFFENNGDLIIIMEFAEGFPISEVIAKKGFLAENTCLLIYEKILEAFSYAHSKNIVHRDIKPANIILQREGSPKILDFGIAKITDSDSKLTRTGSNVGSINYMSPEQVLNSNIDNRSDIYSLGITLFEMLSGRLPYDVDMKNDYIVQDFIVRAPIMSLRKLNPIISENTERAIIKATAKDPNNRYDNCIDFLNALRNSNSAYYYNHSNNLRETNSIKTQNNSIQSSLYKNNNEDKTYYNEVNHKKGKNKLIALFISVMIMISGLLLIYLLVPEAKVNVMKQSPNISDKKEVPKEKAKTTIDAVSNSELTVSASSSQNSTYGLSYVPYNAIDEQLNTWWSPKTNEINSSWIQISFYKEQNITGIDILGGSHYPDFVAPNGIGMGNLFTKNLRIKKGVIRFSDNSNFVFTLPDTDEIQRIIFTPRMTNYVKLSVLEYYSASKWNDLCISYLKPIRLK